MESSTVRHLEPVPVDGAPARMKSVVHTKYGSSRGVELRHVETPTITDEQVLVRVHASSVNPAEWYTVMGPFFARFGNGLRRPKTPKVGSDLAGRIVAVGKDVTDFKPGDEVFGTGAGAWSEYAAAREVRLVAKPANVSFEEAGSVPVAALTALQALRDNGHVQPGQKVLINGASGGVGSFAVQLAKHFGADVTAVCSTNNVRKAEEAGADRICNYNEQDFTRSGVRHDLMLDIAGSRPFRQFHKVLSKNATVVVVGGSMNRGLGPLPHLGATLLSGLVRSQKVKFFVAKMKKEDLQLMADLMASGEVKPVVDRSYALDRVPEALDYLGEGHARGKIVITV
jgi:NADPH:quinone reductase-like Zn-dependent oxidoreductase